MSQIKITGFISEEGNESLKRYTIEQNKKRMPLIGELIEYALEQKEKENEQEKTQE